MYWTVFLTQVYKSRGERSRGAERTQNRSMSMKRLSVLLLAMCSGLLEAQVSFKDNGTNRLTSMSKEERLAALERRLESSEKEVSHLKRLIGAPPAIAFSVALMDEATTPGDYGPFAYRTILPYRKVFANVGNGYNPATGTFTASVRGMYFFRFTMFTSATPNSAACIWKNNVFVVCLWDVKGYIGADTGSNAVVLPMGVGDRVSVMLEPNMTVNDGQTHLNTFSGFLLFPM
uniref:Complement C1q-like protein 2 n=1 Tax=Gadus morhua TaxID=8049 RepID=A0A8C5BHS7_GADMO